MRFCKSFIQKRGYYARETKFSPSDDKREIRRYSEFEFVPAEMEIMVHSQNRLRMEFPMPTKWNTKRYKTTRTHNLLRLLSSTFIILQVIRLIQFCTEWNVSHKQVKQVQLVYLTDDGK